MSREDIESARDAVHDARVRVCALAELVVEARTLGDRSALDRLITSLGQAVAGEKGAIEARDAIRAALVSRGGL